MSAKLLLDQRIIVDEHMFAEIKIWQLPQPVRGSSHLYKYSLSLVEEGICVLRYDNERGKGDHRHCGGTEAVYQFTTPDALLKDFRSDVEAWRRR